MRHQRIPNGSLARPGESAADRELRKADEIFDTRDAINWHDLTTERIGRTEYDHRLRRAAAAHRFTYETWAA